MTAQLAFRLPSLAVLVAAFTACGASVDPGLFSTSVPGNVGGSEAGGGLAVAGGRPSEGGAPATSGGAAGEGSGESGGLSSAGGSSAASSGAGGSSAGGSSGGAGAQAGSGGSNSSAGAGGGGGSTCDELMARAETELEAARGCNLAMSSPQCTGRVTSLCGCLVPVQRDASNETKAYLDTQKEIAKNHCTRICPAIACLVPTTSRCSAPSDGGIGQCTAMSLLP